MKHLRTIAEAGADGAAESAEEEEEDDDDENDDDDDDDENDDEDGDKLSSEDGIVEVSICCAAASLITDGRNATRHPRESMSTTASGRKVDRMERNENNKASSTTQFSLT